MPAEGGPARRLTWLGPDVMVRGWTPDGHILFVTHARPAVLPQLPRLHARPGRRPAAAAAARPGQPPRLRPAAARRVIGRNTADPARWKRYRGGTAGHLWVDAAGSGNVPPHGRAAPATSPARCGSASASISCRDAEGVGNLYSCRARRQRPAAPHRPRRLLRAPRADRRPAHRLPVRRRSCGCSTRPTAAAGASTSTCPAQRTQAARTFVPAADHLGTVHAASAGHSLALDARGKLFTLPLWEGAVRQHGDGRRRALPPRPVAGRRQHAGRRSATRRGEERVEVHTDGARARCLDWDIGRVLSAARGAARATASRSPTIATRC